MAETTLNPVEKTSSSRPDEDPPLNTVALGDLSWRSCVVGHADVPPAELAANPLNWRLHPRGQQQAMAAVSAAD
jgi:hypothetical protein